MVGTQARRHMVAEILYYANDYSFPYYNRVSFAIIPMLVAYPFIQKYFKSGVTLGGVKG